MTAAIVIVAVLLLGLVGAWLNRDRLMKAPLPIITFALVVALGIGVFTHDRQRQADDDRQTCLERVERSLGNRAMWLDLGDYLDQRGATDGAATIRRLLDKDLPVLSTADC